MTSRGWRNKIWCWKRSHTYIFLLFQRHESFGNDGFLKRVNKRTNKETRRRGQEASTAMTSSRQRRLWRHRGIAGFRWRPCRRSAALRCRSSSLVRWWPEKTPRSWSVRPSPCPGRGSSCPRSVGSRESNLWLRHSKEVPLTGLTREMGQRRLQLMYC